MKRWRWNFMVIAIACFACNKQDNANERMNLFSDPVGPLRPRFPPVPRIPLALSRCIYCYQDIVDALGSNVVSVRSVILANGISLEPGKDLDAISYEALPSTQHNSLFDSKLKIEWRWPDGNWQLSTANVWSLGCVYEQAGQPPYTNVIKGGKTILINTCFYWTTSQYSGERIDYLIIN